MNYDAGLVLSIWVGAVVGVIAIGAIIYDGVTELSGDISDKLIGLHFFLFYGMAAGFSAQVIMFNISNLYTNIVAIGLSAIFSAEVESGVISLRVVSFIISFQVIVRIVNHILVEELMTTKRRVMGWSESQFYEIRELSSYIDKDYSEKIIISQLVLYLVVIFTLWFLVHSDISNIYTALLSYSLLFVVDDWIIISHYFEALKGRILKSHIIRIGLFNAIFLVGTIFVSLKFLQLAVSLPLVIFMLLLYIFHYMLFVEFDKKSDEEKNLESVAEAAESKADA